MLLAPGESRRFGRGLPVVRGRPYCQNCGLKGRSGSIHIPGSLSFLPRPCWCLPLTKLTQKPEVTGT